MNNILIGVNINGRRRERMSERKDIYELLEIEKHGKKLTKKEKKRLKVFKEKKAILDKLWTGKCKNCGEPLHKDIEFCSSECRREFLEKK